MNRLELLCHIVKNLDTEKLTPGTITQARLDDSPFVKGRFGPMEIIGIRKEAGEALFNFANTIFSSSTDYSRGTTFKDLYNELSDVIIDDFFGRNWRELKADDVVHVESKVDEWFEQLIASHKLYIPCILSPYYAPPFIIGPVTFVHINDFITQERASNPDHFFTFESLINSMQLESAQWMAIIEIDKCTKDRAWELGELAVDIALVGIQLIVPLHYSQHMARMTARTIPRFRTTVSISNGIYSGGGTNQHPGLGMGPGLFEDYLTKGSLLMKAVGPRVTSFLGGVSALPILEQAWADAAYWFHEGLAEPLDTIAVPKLETAIEVLLRAESASGSKSRLLKAISTFYGLERNQFINPESLITVEKFATGFVTDRSRILHGTWSTLTHSLRDSRPSLTTLVFGLLSNYVLELDRYATIVGATDNIEQFLTSVETLRRTSTAAAS
jgi:hypothetical protein